MSTHTANIKWERDGALFSDAKYSRGHLISFDGGVSIAGSSAPEVVRPPLSKTDAADPEELLCAALASCHMLWFLDFARRAGYIVDSYEDNPIATMGKLENGKIGISLITLRPKTSFAGNAPSPDELNEMHHKAHEVCNIANSLSCPVEIING